MGDQHRSCSRDKMSQVRPMTLCNDHLQVEMHGQRYIQYDLLDHTTPSRLRLLIFSLFILPLPFFLLNFIFLGGAGAEGKCKGTRDEWN